MALTLIKNALILNLVILFVFFCAFESIDLSFSTDRFFVLIYYGFGAELPIIPNDVFYIYESLLISMVFRQWDNNFISFD